MVVETQANILLVDDHPENLLVLEATLAKLGQNLVKACSGQKALKCLLEQDFAVILLDVQMPQMDGFETAALIRQRERSRHTPIIFLTALSDSDALKVEGYTLGAVDYLLKPIDPVILISKVAVFVDLFKKNLEVQQQAAQLVAKNLEVLQAEAARQQAEAANRLKDEFLSIVSHELRTPLNAILGWSQLLLGRKFDETKTLQALQAIERNAKLQTQLVEDILEISRLIRGEVQLIKQPSNIIAIIESVIESLQSLAAEKEIQLTTELDSAAETVFADVQRLRQIVRNLLTNAIKFTPPQGQVMVKLSVCAASASEPSFVQLQVIDTGIGISADFLPYVFDRFRQADSSSTRSYGGLGLGLAITYQLVNLHQGRIFVDSQGQNQGTTFTVHLPLASSTANAQKPQADCDTSANSEVEFRS